MTRGEAYRWAVSALGGAGVENAPLDASLLLAHALGLPREEALLGREEEVEAPRAERFLGLVARRAARVPVSQLLGRREFFGLPFQVDPDVLTPRPETEHLVEWALTRSPRRVLDLGTGSGTIAVAVAAHAPSCCVVAVDICHRALEVARGNALRNGVGARVTFLQSDLAGSLPGARFDLVLSNPPYIREGEVGSLPIEVREHEPRRALVAGPAGTEFHARIAESAPGLLQPGGALGMEVGAGQGEEVAAMLRDRGFSEVDLLPDLAGIGRVVVGVWEGAEEERLG